MKTIYSLLGILWWNLVGQWMYYVYSRGWSEWWTYQFLPRFDPGPPQWWLDTWHRYAWWNNNLVDHRPNTAFVLFYRRAAKDRFSDWIEDAADRIASPLFDAINTLLGAIPQAVVTFSDWIKLVSSRVGTWIPIWTTNLATGLNYLKMKLPQSIFSPPYTWTSIWDSIKTAVKDWAEDRFDAAMTWVANNAPWVVDWIDFLATWYYAAGEWLTAFKEDPYTVIAAALGVAWSTWTGIYSSINDFYNTCWVPYKITLHDFLADPLGWVYDRVEDELCRRW